MDMITPQTPAFWAEAMGITVPDQDDQPVTLKEFFFRLNPSTVAWAPERCDD